MLSQAQRTTILELNTRGVSKREIARVLGISRVAVRKVLRSNSTALPELHRTEKGEPYRQQILELFEKCKGNLVRVHSFRWDPQTIRLARHWTSTACMDIYFGAACVPLRSSR